MPHQDRPAPHPSTEAYAIPRNVIAGLVYNRCESARTPNHPNPPLPTAVSADGCRTRTRSARARTDRHARTHG
jgi:hypothetical protein